MRLRLTCEPQRGATHEQIVGLAKTAEASGFDAFFRSDHYLMNHGQAPTSAGPSDAWITLAGLARETQRIRLGTLVSPVTFRHLGPFAVTVAQVDAMSGGRLEIGLGTGWFEAEHRAFGIPFPEVPERRARLLDLVGLLDRWWTTPVGETFDFHGHHSELIGCPGLPKPQQSRIPLIMGGAGPTLGPRLAAGHADEFNRPFGTPDECAEQYERVRTICAELGVRAPARWSTVLTLACGETWRDAVRRSENAGWVPERLQLLPGRAIGTPEQIVEELRGYEKAGVDTVYLQILDLDDHEHVQLIAEEVLPHLA